MAVKCSKCGEELLGAVNRCWKCGQGVVASIAELPVEAVVVEPGSSGLTPFGQSPVALPLAPIAPYAPSRRATTAELIEARRAGMMAMGGTVASLVLGVFAIALAYFWPLVTMIAVLGLLMGIWGLKSPKRNLAFVGMLLCCLAIGLGTFSSALRVYNAYLQRQPLRIEYQADPTDTDP